MDEDGPRFHDMLMVLVECIPACYPTVNLPKTAMITVMEMRDITCQPWWINHCVLAFLCLIRIFIDQAERDKCWHRIMISRIVLDFVEIQG